MAEWIPLVQEVVGGYYLVEQVLPYSSLHLHHWSQLALPVERSWFAENLLRLEFLRSLFGKQRHHHRDQIISPSLHRGSNLIPGTSRLLQVIWALF